MRSRIRWFSVALIFSFLILAGWAVHGQKAKASRVAWEYKMVFVPKTSDKAQTIMNENGAEGWELIQARFPGDSDSYLVLLFKRLK
jgi:Domain of unknown function (DUF4177)